MRTANTKLEYAVTLAKEHELNHITMRARSINVTNKFETSVVFLEGWPL